MITFKNNDITFTFESIGYQYPDIEEDPYWHDSNWLNIKASVDEFVGIHGATDPAMLTTKLQEIADWFHTISRNEIPRQTILRVY